MRTLDGDHVREREGVFELNLTDRFVDLVDEGYDAVLRLGPIADTSLVARELAPHDQIACASPSYLKAQGSPQTPADLADHNCLGFTNASGLPYADWNFSRGGALCSVRIHSRFQVNDGRVLAMAAVAGGGIILQPEAVLREHLDIGALVPVLTDYDAPSRPMALLFSSQRPQPPKLRAFIDYIVAALPASPRAPAGH
ncbi:LysR substrate-binding domain-containing protein [Acidisoma sp. L85]|uniref:LysR substrate-binding domain-containing protein n=1 Tax=Acidisoma sp. L85 TaxID=1641850 RepID=UPI00131C7284|nr:LysR substrate-binding domain-containing protein [Acidisoma sp. L85]